MIFLNILVFSVTVDNHLQLREDVAYRYGFIPSVFFNVENTVSILTHMFLHSGLSHILSNMLALLWLGSALESRINNARFLGIYLACGFMAALVFGLVDTTSMTPAVGASAAIFGVMGTLVILYPTSFIVILIIPVPVMLIATLYILATISFIQMGDVGPVAHIAHLAGMVSGISIAFLIRPGDAAKGLAIFIICTVGILIMIQFI